MDRYFVEVDKATGAVQGTLRTTTGAAPVAPRDRSIVEVTARPDRDTQDWRWTRWDGKTLVAVVKPTPPPSLEDRLVVMEAALKAIGTKVGV